MRRTLFYGWIVVAVAAVVLVATAGVRAAPGAFLLSMGEEPGWTTGALSFAAAVGILTYGLAGPISGRLMAAIGVRAVTLLSLAITAGALVASTFSREIWQLTIFFGLLAGLGSGLVASVLGPTIANRWFITDRGLVTGVFGASVSAGQLLFFPILTTLAVAVGWRVGALFMAGTALVLIVPVAIWLREDPADVGVTPRGSAPGAVVAPAPRADPGVMRRAVRSVDFWFLAGTFFVCGATSNGLIGVHFISHAVEHGFTTSIAAGALAVMGAFNFVGTLASGWLTDRWDPRKLLLVYYTFRGISLLLLPFVHDSMGIFAFSVLFGLDYIATVPPTVQLCADVFGRHNVGIVYGWVFASHQLGAAIAAWVAGVVREQVGDYAAAFVAAGWIAIVAGFAALAIRRRAVGPEPANAAGAAA
jgi:predicted MFS family arabinose efflux permease